MLNGKRVILYELNEVPLRIIDWFVETRPSSTFAQLVRYGRTYRTYTEDTGHLSPWITWPTLHRGVTNQEHEIYDFGQDLKHVNREYPPLWSLLAAGGRTVGLFGSLHSHPLPADVGKYAFYVPDTFAAGPECFPKKFEVFQLFNLTMVDRSARNVTFDVALRPALEFIRRAPGLGLRARTALDLGRQVVHERIKRERVVRRRTSQVQIAFDFFLKELRLTQPDAAFFFTNHVASSMHRYWPALFPGDYVEGGWPDSWHQTYKDEIPYTMYQADRQLRALVRFVVKHHGYTLIVVSSMGQSAVEGVDLIKRELNISDAARFMRRLGLGPEDWSRRRAMIPLYTFAIAEAAVARFRRAVNDLTVNGKPILVREYGSGVFAIALGHRNLEDSAIQVQLHGEPVTLADLGLVNQHIQDEAGSNAYHIPDGSMIVFDPRDATATGNARPTISTTEIAPSLMCNFGIDVPRYMQRPGAL